MILGQIRQRFGKVFIGGIIGFIAFVFIFYGVFSPKATRGLHQGSVAGTVNYEPVSIQEFRREWNRKLDFFRGIAGGKVSDKQLKSFISGDYIFKDLARQKIMLQQFEAYRLKIADAQVTDKISRVSNFQKKGKFDLGLYKVILESNRQTPASYEKMIREAFILESWEPYFEKRLPVSLAEAKESFFIENEKREIKYLVLNEENLKGDLLPSILKAWNHEKKLATLLKPSGLRLEKSFRLSKSMFYLLGVPASPALKKEIFNLQKADCKQPKQHEIDGKKILFCVSQVEAVDLSKWEEKRESWMKQVALRKAQSFSNRWVDLILSRSRIEKNEAVLDSVGG